ncbi:acyltransferase family protein [Granulibacter bethesdensis]|uniref:acyltransferase family protein n=1 Tax=Granulibacter bethesdensis TaxID=364410 RepID=UPI0003F201C8|nr:acyltransferase [Granulibacter bethesdensis]AHJ66874.1 Acyltransferase family [Granulibacter bethesdensis CGDNIH4]
MSQPSTNSAYGHAGGYHTRCAGLDIFRACAILCVLFIHYLSTFSHWFGIPVKNWLFNFGLLGVDLFFALSGFLVGGLILDIVDKGPSIANWRIFLLRRWTRTLPLYYAVLLVLAVIYPPTEHLVQTLLQYATFTQNLLTPLPSQNWYAVTWSLAIEEWFYVIFGSLAILGSLLIRKSWAIGLALGVMIIAPHLARWFFLTPELFAQASGTIVIHRLDGIALGVLLAVLSRKDSLLFRYPNLFFLMGLGLIIHLLLFPTPLPGRYFRTYILTLYQIGACLCLPAMLQIRRLPVLLDKPVKALSNQAYGLYLFHLPILELVNIWVLEDKIGRGTGTVMIMTLPLILSWASFRYFEMPLLSLRPKQRFANAS